MPYKKAASWYDHVFGRVLSRVHESVVHLAPADQGDSILDVACGTGLLLEKYHNNGAVVTGIDASREMIEQARKRVPGARLIHGNAARMPFSKGEFNIVTVTMALHEMSPETRERVLLEIKRVARPGGLIAIGEYDTPYKKSVSSLFWSMGIRTVERMAGREHYANYKDYMARGGLLHVTELLGLEPVKSAGMMGGNVRIVVLER